MTAEDRTLEDRTSGDLTSAADHVDRVQAEWRRERPDVDVTPQSVVARVNRLANTLTARMVKVYRRYGLTEGEFDVLCALRRAGEPFARRPADLARTTVVTTGGLTKRLDSLEARGLVVREPAPEDARAKIARLTPEGHSLIDDAFTAHMEDEATLISALSDEDRTEMERILRKWARTLGSPDD